MYPAWCTLAPGGLFFTFGGFVPEKKTILLTSGATIEVVYSDASGLAASVYLIEPNGRRVGPVEACQGESLARVVALLRRPICDVYDTIREEI